MKVSRTLLRDDVIENKLVEMQVKYLDNLYSSHSLSTDWLVENNQEGYNGGDVEKQEAVLKNIEELKKNQKNRLRNAEYYKSQIEYLQSILALKDGEFEVNTELKELVI